MVQEFVSPVRVHKFSFEMVMAAYERRFPNCPQIPVVLECVITEDSWSEDDSQRDTSRRCQLNVDAPYLLKKMVGVDYIYFIQKNHLDLKARVLEIEATNESFANRVVVLEKCRYYVHPENPNWTCFEQSAHLDVTNFFGLESTVEKIAIKQYSANITKGKELIESFMKGVEADGITDLQPWKEDDPAHNRELRRIVSRNTEPLSPRTTTEPQRQPKPGPSSALLTAQQSIAKSLHRLSHQEPPKFELNCSNRKPSASGSKTVSKLKLLKRQHKSKQISRIIIFDKTQKINAPETSCKIVQTSRNRLYPSRDTLHVIDEKPKQVMKKPIGKQSVNYPLSKDKEKDKEISNRASKTILTLADQIEKAKQDIDSDASDIPANLPTRRELTSSIRHVNRGRLSLADSTDSLNSVIRKMTERGSSTYTVEILDKTRRRSKYRSDDASKLSIKEENDVLPDIDRLKMLNIIHSYENLPERKEPLAIIPLSDEESSNRDTYVSDQDSNMITPIPFSDDESLNRDSCVSNQDSNKITVISFSDDESPNRDTYVSNQDFNNITPIPFSDDESPNRDSCVSNQDTNNITVVTFTDDESPNRDSCVSNQDSNKITPIPCSDDEYPNRDTSVSKQDSNNITVVPFSDEDTSNRATYVSYLNFNTNDSGKKPNFEPDLAYQGTGILREEVYLVLFIAVVAFLLYLAWN